MKGQTTIQTKHADCFTSDTPVSSAPFSSVFFFDEMVVAINSVSWTIISRSSAIVHDCERGISISAAIKPVNDSIFSATETIIRGTPAIIFAAQIIVSDMQIIVSVTETVISGEPQNPTNHRIADGSPEIIMCDLKTSIGREEAIISVLQITISKPKAVISKRILVMDDPFRVILESQSIICIHEATISVVETIISATEIVFSKASTVISAFLTSFLAAAIVICAAEKTAAAVPTFLLMAARICRKKSANTWAIRAVIGKATRLSSKRRILMSKLDWNSGGRQFGSLRRIDEKSRVIERFTRTAADTVMYEFTIDDPVTYTKPWTAEIPWVKTNGLIFEYACHEGNYALKNVLSGARTAENNSR